MQPAELHAFIGRAIQLGADPACRDKLRELVQAIEHAGISEGERRAAEAQVTLAREQIRGAERRGERRAAEAIARWLDSIGHNSFAETVRHNDWKPTGEEPSDEG